MFVAARVWNAVLFSSGIVLFVAARRVGTSRCFRQGGRSSNCIFCCCRSTSLERRAIFLRDKRLYCLLSLNWTSCLTSRHSTNLERRAVFSRENIILFVLLPWLDEFGTSCCLLTLFAFDRSTYKRRINSPPLDEFERRAGFLRKKIISL